MLLHTSLSRANAKTTTMETLDQNTASANSNLSNKLNVDLYLQISLIGLAIVLIPLNWQYSFLIFYFGLGAYQLASSLWHLAYKPIGLNRKIYFVILGVHGLLGLSLFVAEDSVFLMLFAIMALSTLTAVYYLIITILDLTRIKNGRK
jgi:hypothetical protein